MTEPEPSESDELLKADVLGRVRVRPEHRERMLDAFEASAMSGQAFAIHHGLKVQTFASWMQKRRRKRGDYDDEGTLVFGGWMQPAATTKKRLPFPGASGLV